MAWALGGGMGTLKATCVSQLLDKPAFSTATRSTEERTRNIIALTISLPEKVVQRGASEAFTVEPCSYVSHVSMHNSIMIIKKYNIFFKKNIENKKNKLTFFCFNPRLRLLHCTQVAKLLWMWMF
jgi:hypothetical protein